MGIDDDEQFVVAVFNGNKEIITIQEFYNLHKERVERIKSRGFPEKLTERLLQECDKTDTYFLDKGGLPVVYVRELPFTNFDNMVLYLNANVQLPTIEEARKAILAKPKRVAISEINSTYWGQSYQRELFILTGSDDRELVESQSDWLAKYFSMSRKQIAQDNIRRYLDLTRC